MTKYKSLDDLFNALGFRESSGNYSAVNTKGFLGKYQMGEDALIDAGYYKKNSPGKPNDWSGQFTGKNNVYSKEDFLNNPEAQEKAIRDYIGKQWVYLKNNGSTKYIGSKINNIEITPSGLLAGAHLVGPGGVAKYLNSNGKNDVSDLYGTNAAEYLSKFGGYDVSEITDPNYYGYQWSNDKKEFGNKLLNQGSNLISRVAGQLTPITPIPANKIIKKKPVGLPLSDAEWLKKVRRDRMGL